MQRTRGSHTSTQLADGRTLIVGGFHSPSTVSTAEIYDHRSGAWSNAAPMALARDQHATSTLGDGRVLVAGGRADDSIDSSEVYDPIRDVWSDAGSMAAKRARHTATSLLDGSVLVVGGLNGTQALTSAETYSSRDITPPSITNLSVSSSELESAGGTVIIRATITDDSGVRSADALITKPDNSIQSLLMIAN